MSDRLRELFDQHAELPGDGQPVPCLEWPQFEAAARALLAEAQPQPGQPTDEEWDLEKQHIWCIYKCTTHEGTEVVEEVDFMRALDDARAVLSRWGRPAPEPVSVATDAAWREFIEAVQHAQHVAKREGECPRFDLVETAFALWRSAAPEPVSVAERLPTAADCDANERCWWLEEGSDDDAPTHWLPYWALPAPPQEQADE